MDKKANFESNSTFLLNTLNSFINNISISIGKTENLTSELEKSIKDLTKPINKTKHCLFTNIKTIIDKYKLIHDRFQSKATFITEFVKTSNQPLSCNLIKEECILNNSITLEQPKLVNQIEKINTATSLISKIKESKDFLDLIGLMKEDEEEATESIASSKDLDDNSDNHENKISLLKKKRNHSIDKSSNSINQTNNKKKKISKSINAQPKKLFSSKELLLKIKRKFSGSSFVKKLTKTFIKRRLNRKITYEHVFDYTGDKVIDNRIKTIGEKATYKYCKFIIEFSSLTALNNENVITHITNLFKQNYFIEKQTDRLIFAGKLNDNLLSLIDSSFKLKILKEKFSITKARVYSYEFFEELAQEFDISNGNVKSHFDDQSLNKLIDNWKMIEKIREYVDKQQEKGK